MGIFAFAGPDRGRIREAVDQLRKATIKQLGEEPEQEQYYVGEDAMDQAIARLQNPGLFSPHVFTLVHGADKLSPSEIKLFKALANHPPHNATLVFIGQDPKASADKLNFLPKERIKIIYEMSEGEKKGLIHRFLEQYSLRIQGDALELLCELLSADTDDIRSQCSMLGNMAPPGSEISQEQVEEFIYHSRDENVYTLFEILLSANLASALECLNKIIKSQESEGVGIVLGLQWQYRSLLDLKDAGIRNPSYDDFRSRRIFMKRTQQLYQSALKNFSLQDLFGFANTIARYDQLLREARTGSQGILLELLMYELCSKRPLPLGQRATALFDV
jgi:DNA polymerase III subunit delta